MENEKTTKQRVLHFMQKTFDFDIITEIKNHVDCTLYEAAKLYIMAEQRHAMHDIHSAINGGFDDESITDKLQTITEHIREIKNKD